jgi:hypothetical protein
MAPPGLRVLVHEKPDLQTSYSPKALDGWYLGPALDAYRCYHVWIWETRASHNCNTLSWFPTKVTTMPLASSTDLILAGINDIVNALNNNPSPGSPLAPLIDSHVAKLQQLTTLLTNIIEPLPPANLADINPAPLPDPVESPNYPLLASPLRVEPTSPPLRVAQTTPQSAMQTTDPTPPPPRRPNCTVLFGPLPAPHASHTFTNSTGPTGRKHRRTKCAIPSSMPRKTVHPTQLRRQKESTNKCKPRVTTTKPPKRVTKAPRQRTHQHSYGTRSTTQPLQHVAVTAQALLSTTDPESPAFAHVALHGNAFNNPDTGKLAEFIELSKCSEGALWQHSNAEEIGRLAQGYGNIKGTNTIFFIDPTKIPSGRKITYLRVVSAYIGPKNQTLVVSVGPSAAP